MDFKVLGQVEFKYIRVKKSSVGFERKSSLSAYPKKNKSAAPHRSPESSKHKMIGFLRQEAEATAIKHGG